MVKEIEENNKKYFICEECRMKYADKKWAEKCEQWCKEHHSCNLEIIKHAVSDENE